MQKYIRKEVRSVDNFSEIYRIEAVASLLHAMALSENLVNETPNLNQGLCLLGEVLDDIVCRRTLYNYFDQRIFQARNIDLPRRVRYKKRVNRSKPKQKKL